MFDPCKHTMPSVVYVVILLFLKYYCVVYTFCIKLPVTHRMGGSQMGTMFPRKVVAHIRLSTYRVFFSFQFFVFGSQQHSQPAQHVRDSPIAKCQVHHDHRQGGQSRLGTRLSIVSHHFSYNSISRFSQSSRLDYHIETFLVP